MKKSHLLFLMLLVSINLFSQSWTEQFSGITTGLQSISAVDDNIAWACGASGKVIKTTNKGVNWINVSGNVPTVLTLLNIYAKDENIALVTGVSVQYTVIYHTSNGGLNWTEANVHVGLGDFLWMTSSTDAYFIGDVTSGNWDLLKSTNGGLNWSVWSVLPENNGVGSDANGPCFVGQQVWFGVSGGSKLMYSSNMGTNWVTQTTPIGATGCICFVSPTKGMAAGTSNHPGLILTTNSGTNWVVVTNPYSGYNIAGICYMNSAWFIANGFQSPCGISISSNDGATWTTSYTSPVSLSCMSKSRSGSTIWAVGANGGISRYGTPIIGINSNSTELPSDFALKQNYPNPFNPTTNIKYQVANNKFITLKVFDILGKEVAVLVNQKRNAGEYEVIFDGENLSSGMYYYVLYADGKKIDTKKMLMVK
ncbi:MAG: T9SS type A sorting domain-containing protein [Ignavibacteriae bacterium]|nr:T9SS type A sorting domain-containing protein [Ignavibacteriota bacterium]